MYKKLKAKVRKTLHSASSSKVAGKTITEQTTFRPRTDEEITRESVNTVINLIDSFGGFKQPPPAHVQDLDFSKLQPYQYSSLPFTSSIRLLEFSEKEVSFSTEDVDIEDWKSRQNICRLVTYPLEEAPPYQCLSYTWAARYDERIGKSSMLSAGTGSSVLTWENQLILPLGPQLRSAQTCTKH
jgi:hypothetical protein